MTKRIMAGSVPIGGGAPVSIQSMLKADIRNIGEIRSQLAALEEAGCDIVRAAVPDADAADAVQDALLKAWEKRYSLKDESLFGTWLTRILINVCKQRLRERRPLEALQEHSASVYPDGAADLDLKMALLQLDLKHRIPLLLYHLEGFPVADIAHLLRLPKGTVTSRLARARAKLKDALEEKEGRPHA